MPLTGDVRSLNLASVLQDLTSNEKTGTLTLIEKGRTLHLWLEGGVIKLVGLGSGRGPSVAVGLVATGKMSADELPPDVRTTPEAKLLRRITKKIAAKPEELTKALASQMSEHALETFLWGEARYDFTDGEPDPALFDIEQRKLGARIPTDTLIMEAMRRQDEWEPTRRAIALSGEILVADASLLPQEKHPDPVARRIFAAFDGQRTIREVLDATCLGPFTVYTAVASLRRAGALRPMEPKDALERAKTLAKKGDPEAALRLIDYALVREPSNHELRQLAASCHEATANKSDAVGHYRQLAAAHAEGDRPEEAITTYKKLLALSPGDLYAHEHLFDLLLRLDKKDDAMRVAEGYATAARKAGMPDRARDVYARLIEATGEDEERLAALADLQRQLGDAEGAAELYVRLVQKAVKRHDDDAAAERAAIVVQLDPSRKDIAAIKERLDTGVMRRDRARRRLRRVLFAVLGVLALAASFGVYEVVARVEISRVRPEITQATADGRHRDALALYERLERSWPFSIAIRELAPDREKVEEIHVEKRLADSAEAEKSGDMLGAIAGAADAVRFARKPELAETAHARADALGALRDKAEGELTAEIRKHAGAMRDGGEPLARERLAKLRDPFAVPGLAERLADASADVRTVVVIAAGEVPGDDAYRMLVAALADPDAKVRANAAAGLERRTGLSYGEDRPAWDRWLRQSGPGEAPLVQPLLSPRAAVFGNAAPVVVEWRITNIDAQTIDLVLGDPVAGLRVIDQAGASRPLVRPGAAGGEGAAPDETRRARLAPGEHVGGAIDLRRICPDVAQPGLYRVLWRPAGLRIDDEPREEDAGAVVVATIAGDVAPARGP